MDDPVQKDLHLIYSTSVEDIRFAKRQQWQVTYYALALMIGVRLLEQNYGFPVSLGRLSILIIAVCTIYLLHRMHADTMEYRKRLSSAREGLTIDFKMRILIPPNYLEPSYQREYKWIFIFTVGAVCFALLLFPEIKCVTSWL